jgi:hypothetical protein
MKFANSFSLSKNASIEEYREFSGGVYTHPNKRSDMKCALVGDFNAKTAVLEDFSEPDETFLNVKYDF